MPTVHTIIMENETKRLRVGQEELGLTYQQGIILGYLRRFGEVTVDDLKAGILKEQGIQWSRTGFIKMMKRLKDQDLVWIFDKALELSPRGKFLFDKGLDRLRWAFKGLKETPRPQETRRANDVRLDQGEAYMGPQEDDQAVELVAVQADVPPVVESDGLVPPVQEDISPEPDNPDAVARKAGNMEKLKSLNLGSLGITNGFGQSL